MQPTRARWPPADSHNFTGVQHPCNTAMDTVVSNVSRGCNMRRKHLAWLGRVPANCNHRDLQAVPVARSWRWLPGDTQIPGGDKHGRMARAGYQILGRLRLVRVSRGASAAPSGPPVVAAGTRSVRVRRASRSGRPQVGVEPHPAACLRRTAGPGRALRTSARPRLTLNCAAAPCLVDKPGASGSF